MKKYIIMPEGCRWMEIEATSAEMAYSGVCCWFTPEKRVTVYDTTTGAAVIFSRKLDKAGNLVEVVRH